MIAFGIRYFVAFLILAVIFAFIPSSPLLPQAALDAISMFVGFLYQFDFLVPADTIFTILLLQIPLWLTYYGVRVIHWFAGYTTRGSS